MLVLVVLGVLRVMEIVELHRVLILFQQLVVAEVVVSKLQVFPVVAAEVVAEETVLLVVQERLMKDLLVEQQDQAIVVDKPQVAEVGVRVKLDKQEIVATMPATAETDLPTYFVQAQMKLVLVVVVVEIEPMFLEEIQEMVVAEVVEMEHPMLERQIQEQQTLVRVVAALILELQVQVALVL
jgi:hypothetical protein